MISFISAFKKFKGVYKNIQHSALYSWRANNIEVIIPTIEVDAKINCSQYSNARFIDGIKRGRELGFNTQSPVIKDLIDKALPQINTTMVAFINSDIIILDNFSEIIEKIFNKYGYNIYLVGSRQDIQLQDRVGSVETYKKLMQEKREEYDPYTSSDIFITSKFWWRKIIKDMPEFIMGRYGWDNWFHMYAEKNRLEKYNCSSVLTLLHCKHGFEHILKQEGAKERLAPSSLHNLRLWRAEQDVYGTTSIKTWPKIEV